MLSLTMDFRRQPEILGESMLLGSCNVYMKCNTPLKIEELLPTVWYHSKVRANPQRKKGSLMGTANLSLDLISVLS